MLEVNGLVKSFGEMTAVKDVSFQIKPGEILGLIGQNGAGKTTIFRMILAFLQPNQGKILWKGHTLTAADYNEVGYLPEERGLYPKLTIEEQLVYFARLRGKTKQEILPKIDEWLTKFQVKGKKTDKLSSLSKGNQQKVQLIATLIHQPKLVILDEPFSGLDPVNAALLTQGIIELKAQGSCVIFSSHNMNNVEKICDHLLMLRHGEVVLNGTVTDIRQSYGRTRLTIESQLSATEIADVPGVLSVTPQTEGVLKVVLADSQVGEQIFAKAAQAGYLPVFSQLPPSLEEIFTLKVGEEHV